MFRAVDLEVSRAGNVVGKIPTALHRNDGVLAGMDHQGWHGDRRQDRPHVDPEAASSDARAIPGLAHMRSNMASQGNRPAADGAVMLNIAPLPHPERTARPISRIRVICSTDGT